MSQDTVAVRITRELYKMASDYVERSNGEFKSVDEFVEFCLREILSEERSEKSHYTKEEEEQLKERFKALGYI